MKDKLLQILNEDARLTSKELAERLRITPEEAVSYTHLTLPTNREV